MAQACVHDFELHAILDGEVPPDRVTEILPRLLDDPDAAEQLVALEEQRQALVALREALDAGSPGRSPSAAEIELGQLVRRDRQIGAALAALSTVALLLRLGLESQRIVH